MMAEFGVGMCLPYIIATKFEIRVIIGDKPILPVNP